MIPEEKAWHTFIKFLPITLTTEWQNIFQCSCRGSLSPSRLCCSTESVCFLDMSWGVDVILEGILCRVMGNSMGSVSRSIRNSLAVLLSFLVGVLVTFGPTTVDWELWGCAPAHTVCIPYFTCPVAGGCTNGVISLTFHVSDQRRFARKFIPEMRTDGLWTRRSMTFQSPRLILVPLDCFSVRPMIF